MPRPGTVLGSSGGSPATVTIPLSYFHLLCRAYYGQEGPQRVPPTSPAVEQVQERVVEPKDRDLILAKVYPSTLEPRGFAARKQQEHGRRQHQDHESQGSDSEGH